MIGENRRKYFRYKFDVPLCGDLRIVKIGDKRLDNSKKTLVCIKNMSAGGLLFETSLDFPVRKDVLFSFSIKILHTEILLNGVIRWKVFLEKRTFEYGVEFVMSEEDRKKLIIRLNNVSVKLKKREYAGCRFCDQQRYGCYMENCKSNLK